MEVDFLKQCENDRCNDMDMRHLIIAMLFVGGVRNIGFLMMGRYYIYLYIIYGSTRYSYKYNVLRATLHPVQKINGRTSDIVRTNR